jgi:hypothetical protein
MLPCFIQRDTKPKLGSVATPMKGRMFGWLMLHQEAASLQKR